MNEASSMHGEGKRCTQKFQSQCVKGRGSLFIVLIVMRVRSYWWETEEGRMFINVAYIIWYISIKNCTVTVICPLKHLVLFFESMRRQL